MFTHIAAIKSFYFCLKEKSLRRSVCLLSYFVCLCIESMWHDSSRKGGEPFSLARNKCTSLSLGLQLERPPALQLEWEKWEDVTFPKAAEVRWPISHTCTVLTEVINRHWSWFRYISTTTLPISWKGETLFFRVSSLLGSDNQFTSNSEQRE